MTHETLAELRDRVNAGTPNSTTELKREELSDLLDAAECWERATRVLGATSFEHLVGVEKRADRAEAEVSRLRAALEKILATQQCLDGDGCGAQAIAKAALKKNGIRASLHHGDRTHPDQARGVRTAIRGAQRKDPP